VLLLDEPLSNLDTELRVRMRHEFARLHQQLGATMIYVTHDQLEAMTLANRIVVMANGRIEQVGAPMALYARPASIAVARAIGSPTMNLLPVTIDAVDGDGVTVRLPDGAVTRAAVRGGSVGDHATLGIRPEYLMPDADGAFEGEVELFERLGPLSFAHLGTRGDIGTVVAQLPGDRAVTLGERLRFGVAAENAHLFDEQGRAYPLMLPPSSPAM
jgi:ABC-type sugar transport system ATPase subunit